MDFGDGNKGSDSQEVLCVFGLLEVLQVVEVGQEFGLVEQLLQG